MAIGTIVRRGAWLALALTWFVSCNKPEGGESRKPPTTPRADATLAGGPARPAAAKPATRHVDPKVASSAAELPPVAARGLLLHRLPKSTLFAVRLPHVEKLGEAWRRTPLHSLLMMPQFAEQRAQMETGFAQMSAEFAKQVPDAEAVKAQLMALEGEVVVAIVSIDASALSRKEGEASDTPVTAAVMFDARDHADDCDALLLRLFAMIEKKEQAKPMKLVSSSEGRWHRRMNSDVCCIDLAREGTQFLLQVGPAAGAAVDAAPLGARALEDSFVAADVGRATPDLGRGGSLPVAELFVNLAPIWTATELLAPPTVKNVLSGSGATSIGGISLTSGLGKAGIDEVLTIHSPGGKDLITQVLTNRPLDPKLARYVPNDAATASLSAFDVAALFDGVCKLLPATEKKQLDGALNGMKSEGFDLRGDLLGNIGPTFGFVGGVDFVRLMAGSALPGQGFGNQNGLRGALDLTLLVEIQDAPRFRKMVERFLRTSGVAAHVRPEVVQGVSTSRLEAFPVPGPDGQVLGVIEPSWYVGDDVLVFCTSNAALERSLGAARDASNRGPAPMKEALEKNGAAAWAISTAIGVDGILPATSLGRHTGLGLELTSREGPGTTTAYTMGAGAAIVASVAIPKLLSARLEANEKVAVATLRTILSAEAQFQAACIVDQDHDGRGEYGSLGDLTGTTTPPGSKKPISPPILAPSMAPDARGCFTKSGYVFRVDVPRRAIGGSDAAEQRFVASAWPLSWGTSGGKVYVIDADGKIFFSDNRGDEQHYEGTDRMPGPDASELRDEGDRITGVTAVRRGRDGGIWLEFE